MKKDSAEKDLLYRSKFEIIEPYLYLLPFFLGVAVFTLYPVINVVLMSFQEDYSMLTRSFSAQSGSSISSTSARSTGVPSGSTSQHCSSVLESCRSS